MAINIFPSERARKILPTKKIKKLLGASLKLDKGAINKLTGKIEEIDTKQLTDTALDVQKFYKKKAARLRKEFDLNKTDSIDEALNNEKLLVNRLHNDLTEQIAKNALEEYRGEMFIWLPSEAEEARPEHQLRYGETFLVGSPESEEIGVNGCQCGMQILVDA